MDVRHINNRGLSVVGILIGAATMSVVGLAVAQIHQHQTELSTYLEDRINNINLQNDLVLALSNQDTCKNSLNMGKFDEIANTTDAKSISIVSSTGETVFRPQSEYGKINITSIQAKPVTPIAPHGTGIVEFSVGAERTRGKTKDLATIRLKRKVTLGSALNVIDCSIATTVKKNGEYKRGNLYGKVRNISHGCESPGYAKFEQLWGLEVKWREHCSRLTFPQPRTAYNIYGVEKETGNKLSLRGLALDMKPISEFKIEKLSGASDETYIDTQARGPYANIYQCYDDGVMPLGAKYDFIYTAQVGTNDDGTPIMDTWHKQGQCIGGDWR